MANSALLPETLGLSKRANADDLIAAMRQKVFQLPRLNEALCKTENASLIEILNSINLVSDCHLRVDVAEGKKWWQKKWDSNRMEEKGP